MPRRVLRSSNILFAALFLLGAAVQYNDPDPLGWMLLYLAAAGACVLAAMDRRRRRLHRWAIPAAVGLVALVWATPLTAGVLGRVRVSELVTAWEMRDTRIEEGREMYGLLIISAWMGVLTAIELRRGGRPG